MIATCWASRTLQLPAHRPAAPRAPCTPHRTRFKRYDLLVQEIDEAEGIAAVHEAFKLGVNLFDTSPFYGTTRSERVLGKALVGLPRDQIVVATKVGRYGAEDFDFSAERVTRCFHESLERLQLSYVDIVQCHDVEFGDLGRVRAAPPALLPRLHLHRLTCRRL